MTRLLASAVLAVFLAPGFAAAQKVVIPPDDADLPPIVKSVKAKLGAPDKPFVMLVKIPVKSDNAPAFESAFAVARSHTRKEKGNLAYDLIKLGGDESAYVIHERWASVDALHEHIKTDYIVTFLGLLPGMAAGEPVIADGTRVSDD